MPTAFIVGPRFAAVFRACSTRPSRKPARLRVVPVAFFIGPHLVAVFRACSTGAPLGARPSFCFSSSAG